MSELRAALPRQPQASLQPVAPGPAESRFPIAVGPERRRPGRSGSRQALAGLAVPLAVPRKTASLAVLQPFASKMQEGDEDRPRLPCGFLMLCTYKFSTYPFSSIRSLSLMI